MSTFSDSIPFYMTPETSRALIEHGRMIQAKISHARAVRAAKNALFERRSANSERRVVNRAFATVQDVLDFVDRRQRDRRFATAPMPFA